MLDSRSMSDLFLGVCGWLLVDYDMIKCASASWVGWEGMREKIKRRKWLSELNGEGSKRLSGW